METLEKIIWRTHSFSISEMKDFLIQAGFCIRKTEYVLIKVFLWNRTEYVCDGARGFHAINASQGIDKISKLIEKDELRKRMGQEGHGEES